MAGTNHFTEGNIIGYEGMIGTVKKRCNYPNYWEVEFNTSTRVIHYKNMYFICENQEAYDAGLEM